MQESNCGRGTVERKLRDCAYVNQIYIETRYPSDSYIPVSEEEARDCMDAARKLMELLA